MVQGRRPTKDRLPNSGDTSLLILQKLERIIKEYYEQFYANLGEMDKFLVRPELPTDLRRTRTFE